MKKRTLSLHTQERRVVPRKQPGRILYYPDDPVYKGIKLPRVSPYTVGTIEWALTHPNTARVLVMFLNRYDLYLLKAAYNMPEIVMTSVDTAAGISLGNTCKTLVRHAVRVGSLSCIRWCLETHKPYVRWVHIRHAIKRGMAIGMLQAILDVCVSTTPLDRQKDYSYKLGLTFMFAAKVHSRELWKWADDNRLLHVCLSGRGSVKHIIHVIDIVAQYYKYPRYFYISVCRAYRNDAELYWTRFCESHPKGNALTKSSYFQHTPCICGTSVH